MCQTIFIVWNFVVQVLKNKRIHLNIGVDLLHILKQTCITAGCIVQIINNALPNLWQVL